MLIEDPNINLNDYVESKLNLKRHSNPTGGNPFVGQFQRRPRLHEASDIFIE